MLCFAIMSWKVGQLMSRVRAARLMDESTLAVIACLPQSGERIHRSGQIKDQFRRSDGSSAGHDHGTVHLVLEQANLLRASSSGNDHEEEARLLRAYLLLAAHGSKTQRTHARTGPGPANRHAR